MIIICIHIIYKADVIDRCFEVVDGIHNKFLHFFIYNRKKNDASPNYCKVKKKAFEESHL